MLNQIEPSASGKIFIGGLAPMTNIDQLRRHFGKYGKLTDCVIMQDKTTGKFRGFGFIAFENPNVLTQVLAEKHNIEGKIVDCKRAYPRDIAQNNLVSSQRAPPVQNYNQAKQSAQKSPNTQKSTSNKKTRKIFVGGLPHTVTEQSFRSHFAQYGVVESCSIMRDKATGKARGFGFVIFTDEASVDRVIEEFESHKIDNKWVECRRAVPKSKNETNTISSECGNHGEFTVGYHNDMESRNELLSANLLESLIGFQGTNNYNLPCHMPNAQERCGDILNLETLLNFNGTNNAPSSSSLQLQDNSLEYISRRTSNMSTKSSNSRHSPKSGGILKESALENLLSGAVLFNQNQLHPGLEGANIMDAQFVESEPFTFGSDGCHFMTTERASESVLESQMDDNIHFIDNLLDDDAESFSPTKNSGEIESGWLGFENDFKFESPVLNHDFCKAPIIGLGEDLKEIAQDSHFFTFENNNDVGQNVIF